MLDEAFAVAAGDADERVAVEGAEDEVDVEAGIGAEVFCPHLDGVDFRGGPAERFRMISQRANPPRAICRGIGGTRGPDRHRRVGRTMVQGS